MKAKATSSDLMMRIIAQTTFRSETITIGCKADEKD